MYNSLGEALYRNGQPEEAEQWFIKALRTKPDHVPAHLTYGKMLARNVSNHFVISTLQNKKVPNCMNVCIYSVLSSLIVPYAYPLSIIPEKTKNGEMGIIIICNFD